MGRRSTPAVPPRHGRAVEGGLAVSRVRRCTDNAVGLLEGRGALYAAVSPACSPGATERMRSLPCVFDVDCSKKEDRAAASAHVPARGTGVSDRRGDTRRRCHGGGGWSAGGAPAGGGPPWVWAPWQRDGFPEQAVSLREVPEANVLGAGEVGAAVPLHRIDERVPEVLHRAASGVGTGPVRRAATVGGNIV